MLDAVVVGCGFYGAAIAVYLARERGLQRILVVERESAMMRRASYNNQARIHNGYHYPRSFTTAFRSRVNLPRFVNDWPSVVKRDFTKLYAVARRNSKVSAGQFQRFCKDIGARVDPASSAWTRLFEPRLVEAVYEVDEFAFDTVRLAQWAEKALASSGAQVVFGTTATALALGPGGGVRVTLAPAAGATHQVDCRYLFNCTYSGLNQFGGDFLGTRMRLKHEITEMALIQPATVLQDVGVTVMDGPFFSFMPFPSRGLHTLSHVRYTPHQAWLDEKGRNPYGQLAAYDCASRVDRMLRDVSRYLPVMAGSRYVESLFEVKTVLVKN